MHPGRRIAFQKRISRRCSQRFRLRSGPQENDAIRLFTRRGFEWTDHSLSSGKCHRPSGPVIRHRGEVAVCGPDGMLISAYCTTSKKPR
jgi:hypothetical protein